VRSDDVPVVICRGTTVLRNPTNAQLAGCLGFNEAIDQTHTRDVAIVGAGPSGLAAAVYGASEGLEVVMVEMNAGVSGQELADRAYMQAEKFGAQIIIASGAEYRRLSVDGSERFKGAGMYYGATFVEAQMCLGEDVIVVGGANSAGQSAVYGDWLVKAIREGVIRQC
jgi:thioredoxin reductase (NADPH)